MANEKTYTLRLAEAPAKMLYELVSKAGVVGSDAIAFAELYKAAKACADSFPADKPPALTAVK